VENKSEQYKKTNLVWVRFRSDDPPVRYHSPDLKLKRGDWVIVPAETCLEVAEVVKNPLPVHLPARCLPREVKSIASPDEMERHFSHLQLEADAWKNCEYFIKSLNLSMKLIKVRYLFDESKLVLFYYAKSRVDFRELVKELVKTLKTRIEMRQIGIRHTAKMLGGMGTCGKELCCATFINTFEPVSIKMAKVQNLPLNPNKISGLCGRLLCCLTYEYENYLSDEERARETLARSGEDEDDLEKTLIED
jgi:cell fate regulator YaaT (PSP1 superfamily)